jgi:peptidoglycan/xylan/chitin deacetylase (PgdA/CDA1 family)
MYNNVSENKRYNYSLLCDRDRYLWPNNKKIAIYFAINVEHFSFGDGLGAVVNKKNPEPDVANYSWRDYGNRVGIWRLHKLSVDLQIPVSLLVNSSVYGYAPKIIDMFRSEDNEIIAHGFTNSETQADFSVEEEYEFIRKCTAIHTDNDGVIPSGWLSPWLSETSKTSDLLKKIGYKYTLNWCHDDQPTLLSTDYGDLLSIPYPQEINDIPAILIRSASASDFRDMIIDHFTELAENSDDLPMVMGIAVHPYIMGQPHRISKLRQALEYIYKSDLTWKTTPGKIAQYVLENDFLI